MKQINSTGSDKKLSKGTKRFILEQVHRGHSDEEQINLELKDILGNESDPELNRFDNNFDKILKGREIIKKVIFPLMKLQDFINELSLVKKSILDIHLGLKQNDKGKLEDSKKSLESILSQKTGIDISEIVLILGEKKEKLNANGLIEIIKKIYSNEKNPMIKEFISILESESENISLKGSMSTGNYEEIPSFDVFIETINMEIGEYLKKINFLSVKGDNSVINSIMTGQWLKEQKSSSYIKLPFFDDMIKKIEKSKRNGKVGQVVLKGPPGTGKTRIFEHLGEKLRRPIKVISMHEYINFYELLIQSTNLSPSKNQIEFIDTIIKNYKEIGGEDLIGELEILFDKNKDKFPSEFNLIDFINNIFDSSKYLGDETKKAKLETIEDPEKVKKFVLDSLSYWKSEKIFTLLLNKKEIIEGELLNCISNGQIPLLDEIDKVKEKEINGILAFLDLETGRSHKIQGTDREIFIPEWFGVYATSNDDLKPSGPLGRRFNSMHFDYLDIENMTLYLVSRIVDNELSCPFDNLELGQIKDCLSIIASAIEKNNSDGSYKFLDFSIRLLDNFINGFIQRKDGIVQKKFDVSNKDTFIYDALKNAFEMQTEDIYGNKSIKSTIIKDLGEQKKKILGEINAKIRKLESERILNGARLSKGVKARVNSVLRKLDLGNILLRLIVSDQRNKKRVNENGRTRILNYSEQVSRILNRSDIKLNSIISKESVKKEKQDNGGNKTFNIKTSFHEIILDFKEDDKTLDVSIDNGRKVRFSCESIEKIKENELFLINQGAEKGGYLSINIENSVDESIIYTNLSDIFYKDGEILEEVHNFSGERISKSRLRKDKNITYLNFPNNKEEYRGDLRIETDETGLFIHVFHNNGMDVDIYPIVNEKIILEKLSEVSYFEKIKKFIKLSSFSVSDFGLPKDGNWVISNIKFDSTFEYIFVNLSNKTGEIVTNTIKL
ncbi:AAA family ATPase [Candidatus Gracilibacteria bacterium]|nr:AAA family ATPase [Candidatus Gracilibacteria bacterium]